ncbi:MAG: peptidylprolyl isomerase [Gallionellaceae bacterium]|nr:peptidylprolyl isomerase [Gallionellaceae bacterium]
MLPYKKIIQILLLWLACSWPAAYAQAPAVPSKSDPQKQAAAIDQIVAVVNDDVITLYELQVRVGIAEQQLKKRDISLPAAEELKKQVLDRMIMDLLQTQFAKETGVRIDDTQLDKAMRRIAQENKFASPVELRAQLEKEGVDFKKFREEIRGEIIAARLREREVDSKLVISDGEVENYLSTQVKQAGKSEEYQLAHILVLVPEQASADKIEASRQRAAKALAELRSGADFAQVAAGYSNAKDALQGGNLGWRAADSIPTLFQDVLKKMKPGDTSEILRSSNGFHIFKLVDQRIKDIPQIIKQTHARHILIKTSELVPDNEAMKRLLEIKRRIEGGASFVEQAKRYSEDGSAAQGGDLGWISPGDTVPEFEEAMNALQDKQMSGAVQSGFGWHLIQVLERRSADISMEQKKQQARVALRAVKSDEAYQDWLRQLRDRAYIEIRLEAAR